MNFLNPGLLAALLPLLALPVLIHFLNKKFPQRFAFSSVEHLRKTAAERSWLHRWRHRILTLLRTLFLLLLLFVFLKPVLDRFGAADRSPGHRRVLLLVDASLSMDYVQAGLSNRKRAGIEAEKILGTLGPDDEVNLIGVGHVPTVCFTDFSRNVAEARRFLDALPSAATRADFTQANIAAGRLLEAAGGPVEIYYLSDFQRKNWGRSDFSSVEGRARLFYVDVAEHDAANHAVLGVELGQAQVLAGDTVPLEVTVGNFAPQPLHGTLTVRVGRDVELQQAVEVAPWSSARVVVPVPASAPGAQVCEVSLPPDNLPRDDRWVLTLPVMEKEEIVTVSADGDPGKDPVKFLHAALNPFPDRAGSLLPHHVASERLDAGELAAAKKVFITRCGPLDDAAAETLVRFLHRGGSVVWFLDGDSDAANLEAIDKAAGGGLMPIRLGALRRTESVGTGAQQITSGDFKARLLRLFRGALRQDLGLLEFYDFHAASATGAGKVLLRFGDETPAMAVADHGLGTLVLMNFSVGELSSNLARQRIFPAWIQDLVKQLNTTPPAPLAFVAGQVVEGEVWKDDLRRHAIASPSGSVVDARQEVLGERAMVSFVGDEPGFYRLEGARGESVWAVNSDPEESDLRRVDVAQLPVSTDEARTAGFVSGQSDYDQVAHGRPLWHWFLLAGAGLLLVELLVQLKVRRATP